MDITTGEEEEGRKGGEEEEGRRRGGEEEGRMGKKEERGEDQWRGLMGYCVPVGIYLLASLCLSKMCCIPQKA